MTALPDELRYRRPLQKPIAKLLYHSITGGSGQRNFVARAGSMIRTGTMLEINTVKNVLKNPAEVSLKLASRSEDR